MKLEGFKSRLGFTEVNVALGNGLRELPVDGFEVELGIIVSSCFIREFAQELFELLVARQ